MLRAGAEAEVFPPSSIDIVELFAISQSLPTSLPTQNEERKRKKKKEISSAEVFSFYFCFPQTGPVHTPSPLPAAGRVAQESLVRPQYMGPVFQIWVLGWVLVL